MKYFYLIILSIFITFQIGITQSLDDIKQLQQLKKQLESMDKSQLEKKSASPEVESLQVYQDSLSKIPKIETTKTDVIKKKQEPDLKDKDPFADLPFFGHEVFANANIDFKPEVYGPVDELYPVGAGDEIIISIWGEVELRHDIIVNREGQIFIPEVGLVKVTGLNVKQLKKKLIAVMGKSYSSLLKNKAYLDVALGKLRSIRLFVVGSVQNPGVFTVPALTSVFNMLFYAGGVKETGSLRKISLVRKDKAIAHLDFYEFLTKGKKFSNTRLQNQDVILIHTAAKHVYLKGAVKKEAIYELINNEGVKELIDFTGGFKDNAYVEQIQIERYVDNKDRKLIDINYKKLKEEGNNFTLKDGDRILVKSLNRELINYITLSGMVYGPKRFEYYSGMTICDLFARVDSIRGDAYLDRVHITRTLPDHKKQIFSINLNEFLTDKKQDFLLAPQDHIEIKSINTLFPPDSVYIYGAVNIPGKFVLKKDITLKDLIFAAGGFSKDALISEAEISRIDPRNSDSDKLATILYVDIDSNYTKQIQAGDELFFLEPYDNVFIRSNSDWELQRNVVIEGEVKFPGAYTLINKTERITDLIKRAGGLKQTAYIEGAKMIRTKNNVGQIGIDFEKIFKKPGCDENIYLQGGDKITIPERFHTVKIVGGINFPNSVLFEPGKGLGYYINAAGGYVDLADVKNVSVRLANGKTFQRKRFLFWKYLPEDITAGSSIYVPVLLEKEKIDWSGAVRDAAAILSGVATTILIIDRISQ
jgi:protein involved in polysaccharide export with SLBB domain